VSIATNNITAALQALRDNRTKRLKQFYGRQDIVRLIPGTVENPADRYARQWQNWMASATVFVSDSTSVTYSTGVRLYQQWCTDSKVDPQMIVPPAFYTHGSSPFSHQVTSFGNFIGYLAFDLSLSPQTIRVYRYGIAAWFKSSFLCSKFMDHPVLSQLAASLEVQWRASHEVAETRRLPFTLQMFIYLRTRVCNVANPMEHAIVIAVMICLVLLTRKSEIIPTADDHFMREDDVSFTIRSSVQGASDLVIKSSQAHLHQLSDLVGVVPFVRSAKNDQDGQGTRYYFPTITVGDRSEFCFATEMFKWAQRARPIPGDPFLTYRGILLPKPRWLDYKSLLIAIKNTAISCGFDPSRFGTHSLRIGGATILAAAGLPNHYIQKIGRWKSLTFLQYINLACKSMETSLRSIVDASIFTNDQLRILNPL